MKLNFQNCKFIVSSDGKHFPKQPGMHLVLLGRSNVGKSSLINHLCRNKTMAKVSNTPGKTRCINFFSVDDKCLLVDLPGYGYAKRGHEEREKWEEMLAKYFDAFDEKIIFFQLVDGRHEPTELDLAVADWVEARGKKVHRILTKMDKIKESASSKGDSICYTIKDGACREVLIRKMECLLSGTA